VVVNKGDLAGAPRAAAEVTERLTMNHKDQKVFTTQAKKHRDGGVDRLYDVLFASRSASPVQGKSKSSLRREGSEVARRK
jgi:putative protein kinase ArgK-like GTPase of G3E family